MTVGLGIIKFFALITPYTHIGISAAHVRSLLKVSVRSNRFVWTVIYLTYTCRSSPSPRRVWLNHSFAALIAPHTHTRSKNHSHCQRGSSYNSKAVGGLSPPLCCYPPLTHFCGVLTGSSGKECENKRGTRKRERLGENIKTDKRGEKISCVASRAAVISQ